VAGLGWTVAALLMVLIGGIGTLSGAIVGAAVFRLLQFYLDKWFGEAANLLIGTAYVGLVLFVPYGIVGTWRARGLRIEQGWQRLVDLAPRSAKAISPAAAITHDAHGREARGNGGFGESRRLRPREIDGDASAKTTPRLRRDRAHRGLGGLSLYDPGGNLRCQRVS
jgi:hypothetical protein